MNKFEELQTFAVIADTGSISQAAQRMGIAKSAVSRRLSDLEKRLNVQLFRRTTRQMNLTESGHSFYERAQQILSDLEEAEVAVSQQHCELAGKLKISAPLTFGLQHLSPAIIEFNNHHPGILFDVDFNDRQIDLVEENFDMAVRITQLQDSSLIARKIATTRLTICASPDYLGKHGAPQIPEDLKSHQCLVYSQTANPDLWKFTDSEDRLVSVKIPVALCSNNGEFLRQAALEHQGIALLPNFNIYKSLQSGALQKTLKGFNPASINVYAVYPQTRHLSRRVRAFIDFLVARFAGIPYWEIRIPD